MTDNAPLDTSDAAQDAKRASMADRLAAAGAATVSELSPLFGQAIVFDGVAGTVICVHDTEDRFSAALEDGRRPWGITSAIVAGNPLTYTSLEG